MTTGRVVENEALILQHLLELFEGDILWILPQLLQTFLTFGHGLIVLQLLAA